VSHRNLVNAGGRFLCPKGTASPLKAKLLSRGRPKPGATPSVSIGYANPLRGGRGHPVGLYRGFSDGAIAQHIRQLRNRNGSGGTGARSCFQL
jgi:hypothetical protein